MTAVRFLCDENVDFGLLEAIGNREPALELLLVGDPGAPPLGSPDPDLLQFAERTGYALFTGDRSTMPTHLIEHHAAGRHTWGVFLIRRKAEWAQLVNNILLIWSASEADDWRDRLEYLPW